MVSDVIHVTGAAGPAPYNRTRYTATRILGHHHKNSIQFSPRKNKRRRRSARARDAALSRLTRCNVAPDGTGFTGSVDWTTARFTLPLSVTEMSMQNQYTINDRPKH